MLGLNGLGINSYDDIGSIFLPIQIDASKTILGMRGNVGIGTTSPGANLDIRGSNLAVRASMTGTSGANGKFQIFSSDLVNNPFGEMQFYAPTGAGSEYLRFNVSNTSGSLYANALTINRLGNVGIGTANPQKALDVNGDINVSGNINAKYQDMAEWVPCTQKLPAGTVVVLDASKINHVLASIKSYDTSVAGVVSEFPGIILGEGGNNKLKIATTGRVKVKVNATKVPIKVGDLLVTSDIEGFAMKSISVDLGGTSIHRPGTIIGKALEPLAGGTGEILVLLSLQ
jgi:hypothetical protein